MIENKTLRLYLVTDRTWLGDRTLAEVVEQAIEGGVTMVQLREKKLTEEAFINEAKKIKEVTDRAGIPLIINDDAAIAAAVNADGVHIGQSDGEVRAVRQIIGKDRILGVSARTVEQAIKAEQDGADYLGVGAVFGTTTKTDAKAISFETLQAICSHVSIPVVAIGGVNETNIEKLAGSGIAGVAVISAILSKPAIQSAALTLKQLVEQVVE